MIPLSPEAMAAKARLVVRGTVAASECRRDDTGRIYTRIELDVAEVWKGTVTTKRLPVVFSGGRFDGVQTVVPGQVEYPVGSEVVAFLVLNERGEGVTVGLAQGKFHVFSDPVTAAKQVWNPFHGRPAGENIQRQGLSMPEPLTLEALKRRVQGGAQ